MSSLDLDAIEALDERMPVGPWERTGLGSGVWHPPSGHLVPLGDALQFAAEARAMLPALVARVRELEAEVKRVAEMYYDQKDRRKKFGAAYETISRQLWEALDGTDWDDPKERRRTVDDLRRIAEQHKGGWTL